MPLLLCAPARLGSGRTQQSRCNFECLLVAEPRRQGEYCRLRVRGELK